MKFIALKITVKITAQITGKILNTFKKATKFDAQINKRSAWEIL